MSAEPLTPRNTAIVVACKHANQANDAMAKYGPEVAAKVIMFVCTDLNSAEVAKAALPPATPWTIMHGADTFVVGVLQRYFGAAKGFSYCIEAQNNEYAIHPRKLNL